MGWGAATRRRENIQSCVFRGYMLGNTLLRGYGVTISRVSPPPGGEIKSNLVFSGDIHLGNALLRGYGVTIPQESNPIPPASPHKSPWTLGRGLGRFGDVTPRLFATAGFPTIRDTNRPAMPSLVCIPHFGPSSLLTTARSLRFCLAEFLRPRRRNQIQSRVFRGHAPRKTLCSGGMG